MPKEKYINQKKQMVKNKVLFVVALLAIVLLLLLVVLAGLENAKKKPKYHLEMTLKEALANFDCELFQLKNSLEEGFEYDLYVNFGNDLYEGEISKENYYHQVIEEVARCLAYKNFRLLDEQKSEPIEIRVICAKGKIQKIWINGKEDYFIYHNSQKDLEKYAQIPNTEIEIQAPELIQCIQNQWKPEIDFGTRESIFQNYYVYFEWD